MRRFPINRPTARRFRIAGLATFPGLTRNGTCPAPGETSILPDDDATIDEIRLAIEYLRTLKRGRDWIGSYRLKHSTEYHFARTRPRHVSNGALICAAIGLGLPWRHVWPPNVEIGALDARAERRRRSSSSPCVD